MPTVTPDLVAAKLAPIIHLHSKDPHRPMSVETFLSRCQVVTGSGELASGGADLPAGMTLAAAGPLTPDKLKAASSSTAFGGGEIDDISLFPLPAAAGRVPRADWSDLALIQGYFSDIGEPLPETPSSVPVSDPHFYNYQLETFLGNAGPRTTTNTTPIYVRIATRENYYLISYCGFFGYNGGLGPQTDYASRPLGSGSGFGAHIGDWIRMTAKVTISQDKVSLLYIDRETHGDSNIDTSSNFSGLSLDQVPRLTAYAAWHSHELYATTGIHLRREVGFTANDYTDDAGPVWDTAPNLTFISDDGPAWVFYNGLWGANMIVPGLIQNYLKNGPQGPAFHWYWTSETKDGHSPVVQWRPPPVAFNVTGNAIGVGSSPAAAAFKGRSYIAFQANDPSHTLYVTSSSDGTTWVTPAAGYSGIKIGSAPAMAEFNGRLYIAFQANDPSHTLYVTSSSDGTTWVTPAIGYPGIKIGSAPAMAAFNGRLYIAFQADDPSNTLYVTSSSDGKAWTTPAVGYPGIKIGGAPAMAAFNQQLYIGFQANDPSHSLYVTRSSDGSAWTTPAVEFTGIKIGSAPTMAVWNQKLFLAFQANDPSHLLYVTETSDGTSWLTPASGYPGIQVGSAPALTTLNNQLYLAFQANDPSHILYTGVSE